MKKVLYYEMRRTEIAAAVKENAVVIIPCGSTEQHGEHLPINTDCTIVFEIAKKAAETVSEFSVLVLPPLWTGYSPHHMGFPGAITLRLDNYLDTLAGIARSLHAHGFKNILFLNGHGGNTPAVASMRYKMLDEEGFPVIGYDYWSLPGVTAEIKRVNEVDKGVPGHASEFETSMALFLRPELVEKSLARWVPGVRGDPAPGTREKGERLFNFIVNSLIGVLKEYHSGRLEERLIWSKDMVENNEAKENKK
jgi:creatinine amidohydrolase